MLWPAVRGIKAKGHSVRAIFSRGAEPSLPGNYFARLTPLLFITKNAEFRALYLARQNELRFFV